MKKMKTGTGNENNNLIGPLTNPSNVVKTSYRYRLQAVSGKKGAANLGQGEKSLRWNQFPTLLAAN